ncbi:Alpha/Beta hydrolase protein [Aspergillus karnatakaensis]|uniref:Alpha/Beta hydrolase protein n=1 Tax=Aspergillus karnatakaensis TaxID=1810916 RepID=UPI003CCE4599
MLNLLRLGLLSQSLFQDVPLGSTDASRPSSKASIPTRQLNGSFCPAHTAQHTGSIGLDHGKDLFYWFFESATNPSDDPLIVWLTGGPGVASTFAALTEIGPCLITEDGSSTHHNPHHNPHHWARTANLLILEYNTPPLPFPFLSFPFHSLENTHAAFQTSQPAGVGWSLAATDPTHAVTTLEQATEDFIDFMHLFVTHRYPSLSKKTLHIAGESYGGRWAPAFMHRLYQLAQDKSTRSLPNRLGSIILVNAVVGTLGGHLSTATYEFGCTDESVAAKLGFRFNETVCSSIQELAPGCEENARWCEATRNKVICLAASQACVEISSLVEYGDRSLYNACKGWFDQAEVKEALGVRGSTWMGMNYGMEEDFNESGATTQSVGSAVSDLLDSGSVRVLVLTGDLDALVPTAGQIRVFDELAWRGQVGYRYQKWKDGEIQSDDGVSRGRVKYSGPLAFVTFESAGHMVPGDDPAGAAAVLDQWLGEAQQGVWG